MQESIEKQIPALRFLVKGIIEDADQISADTSLNKAHQRYIEDIKKRGASLLTIFDGQAEVEATELPDEAPVSVTEEALPQEASPDEASAAADDTPIPLTVEEEEQLYDELNDINTLDVEAGLSNMENDKNQYLKLLCRFCDNCDQWRSVILKDMKIGYWKEYAMRFEILAKTFDILGNKSLSELSAKLNAAYRKGDMTFCLQETTSVCDAMIYFRDELLSTTIYKTDPKLKLIKGVNKRFVIESNQEKLQNNKKRVLVLIEKLKELRYACDDFKANEANQLAWFIKNISIDERIDAFSKTIVELVASLDYDKAVLQAKRLVAILEAYDVKVKKR
ncbi:MAG: hypothetical protein LBT01_03735 [Spirochaetaceae bacterium]|jgi:hypothetical protein|nr:hypothetical protein [Spirochaetaceae bacterium]